MRVLDAELPMLNLVSTACSLAPDVRFLRGQPLRFFFPLACCRGTVQGRHPYLKPLRPAVGFFLFGHFSRPCRHPQFWDLDSGGEGPRSPGSSSHLATTSTCARSPRLARPSGRCFSRPRPDFRRPSDREPSALPHLLSPTPRVWLG